MKYSLKQEKAVAGLTVLLSLITMLFIIGLLVMIFALMGSELAEATDTDGNPNTTSTAQSVINDTTSSIATVTSWFTIFIVIGAMVVLILLTVIIITAIRGSGLMATG